MVTQQKLKVMLLGGGAREHAIGEALCRTGRVELVTVAHNRNPGLESLSTELILEEEKNTPEIVRLAVDRGIELAVIGLEDPLDAGLPDQLSAVGIPTIGPCAYAAQLEMSKLFTRQLMERHGIPAQPDYFYFEDPEKLASFLYNANREFALKPIGLTAGKGVKVMGLHLTSVADAVEYGRSVIGNKIGGHSGILLEERLLGEEFTLQAFVDGLTVLPMPLVKDYKAAYDGDVGPNTGSMGSYSQSDGLLPFVDQKTYDQALSILKQITVALTKEGYPYKGIMYGQFMVTRNGLKLVEINARFGDPEAINVLATLENDFVDICKAIASGTLETITLKFEKKATVCKYVTPPDYPENPKQGVPLELDTREIEALGVKVFFAKVNPGTNCVLTTSSRAIAFVATGKTVDEAEGAIERALVAHVRGDYHIRHDIGTKALRDRSVSNVFSDHLSSVR